MSLSTQLNASPLFPKVARFLGDHRGFVVVTVALPASFVYEHVRRARDILRERFGAAPEEHDERVHWVQEQVRRWKASGSRQPMCTARPEWQTVSSRTATYKRGLNRIEVDLKDVLGLDEEREVVVVEPLVNMGQLTRYLAPRGWALAVQVEMEDLTAGGLSMGCGIETSCHRFGLWQETVEAYELVLADGTRRRITRESDPELFFALPWSHGTLGFLTAVELKVVRIKPYVRMLYIPCHSMREFGDKLRELTHAEDTPDLIEGTIYSRDTAVIQCGWYSDAPADRSKINPINRYYKPWFFKHVARALDDGPFEEWVPTRHYFHRHTRSIFWELEELIPFGNHPVYRYLLGWLGAPKVSLLKRTMTEEVRHRLVYKHVVQDMLVPLSELETAVEHFHQWFEVYPLLVMPFRQYDHGEHQGLTPRPRHCVPGKSWEMYFDLGVYGIPPAVKRGEGWDAARAVRAMEAYARSVAGFTMLWADIFMNRAEFEQMFDHSLYRRMREKVGAIGAFPEVWDKVKPQHSLKAGPAPGPDKAFGEAIAPRLAAGR